MRKLIKRMICVLAACLMAFMPADCPLAASANTQDIIIEDNDPVMSVRQERELRRLSAACRKEQQNWLHFEKPSYLLVKNRMLRINLNRTDIKVTYKSSSKKIASVSKSGVVRTNASGIAVITAKSRKHVCHTVVCVLPKNTDFFGRVRNRVVSANEIIRTFSSRKKTILIAGSSAMDRWADAPAAFPSFNVINNAIGGSQTIRWLAIYRQLIVSYKPDAVILFIGSNDIGKKGKITGQESAARISSLIVRIREALGDDVPIFYVSMLTGWSRRKAWRQEKASNAAVCRFCSSMDNVYYIDVASSFLDKQGRPVKSLFASDGLHPSQKGYQIFRRIIGKAVARVMGG